MNYWRSQFRNRYVEKEMFNGKVNPQVWKIFVLSLVLKSVWGGYYPCGFIAGEGSDPWLEEDGRLIFPSYLKGDGTCSEAFADGQTSCSFSERTNDISCKDSIDFNFLREMQGRRIRTLTVEKYNRRGTMRKSIGRKRLQMLKEMSTENFFAELHLKEISVKMSTSVDLQLMKNGQFAIDGEIFSNRIIKMGWKYSGSAVLYFSHSGITFDLAIESSGNESGWKLYGMVDISVGEGKFRGYVTHDGGLQQVPQLMQYRGGFTLNKTGDVTNVSGQLEGVTLKISGDFVGRLTKYISAEITIPKRAFSGMTIENLAFRDSNFFGDFHTESFEGIKGLETIQFIKSRMEFMPDYNTVFRGPSLKAIYIEDCYTPTISMRSGCSVRNLEFLSFKGSGFLEFSKSSFRWLTCSRLMYLNFHDTNLKLIGNDSILQPVSDTLRYLDISYSTLRNEPNLRQFLNGTKITHLSMAGLQLKTVPATALEEVRDTVEYLSLRRNTFAKIPGENFLVPVLNFPKMPALKELDLHDCRINYIEKSAFDPLENLEKLDLSGNNVVNLQDGWGEIKPKIVHLNLSHNGVVTRSSPINLFDLENPFDLGVFDQLETLDLSFSDLWNSNRLIMNANYKLKYLSLCKCGLRFLNNSLFGEMPNLEEVNLSGNPSLGKTVFLGDLINLEQLRRLHLASSAVANLTFGNGNASMNNLEYLDLSHNFFQRMRPGILRGMPNLRVLKLSRNSISAWNDNSLMFTPFLEKIYLDYNKIETLKSNAIDEFTGLDEVTLRGNPFMCGQYVMDFTKRIRFTKSGVYLCPESVEEAEPRHRRDGYKRKMTLLDEISNATTRKVYLYSSGCARINDWFQHGYLCYSSSYRRLVPFSNVTEDFDECQDVIDDYFNWAYVMVTFCLLLTFLMGFLWWKWWNFRLFTKLIKNAAIFSFIDDGECGKVSYEYDAFVSYSDRDRQWVAENLIPNLERMEDVNICLHERDFQVGLSILENIVTSIDKSKCVILVLSQAFMKSQWCQYEMHLAYHRLLETRRDQMILILLENIPRFKRPRILQYLMMTKTYIQWPSNAENKKELEIFWNRLFKALARVNQIY